MSILPTSYIPIPKEALSSDRVKKERAKFILTVVGIVGDQFNLDSRSLLAYGKYRS